MKQCIHLLLELLQPDFHVHDCRLYILVLLSLFLLVVLQLVDVLFAYIFEVMEAGHEVFDLLKAQAYLAQALFDGHRGVSHVVDDHI